ncbi:uromodulin-like [Saccostrea echinata]|uniref:uromodulin-like n=1 Tax=Saccostrea echinata TaxID=191078 RepID=UPI002A820E2D|nr:uromodulin-like [Saccostrea echinata]
MILFVVFIEIEDASHHCIDGDPCFVAKEMYQPYARAEVCVFNSQHAPCDRYLTPGWYKSDEPLLDRCPDLLRCGAVYPVWLNASLPNATDGTVSRKTCRVGFNNCCSKEYEIKIKLCGSFYAFCFPSLDSCSERFCFGRNGSCEYPDVKLHHRLQIARKLKRI